MRPLLLIDAGNTRVKWATVTAGGQIKVAGQVRTAEFSPSRAKALAREFSKHRVFIASVVPAASKIFGSAFPLALFINGRMRHLPLAFSYPKPGEIGADRIAAAVGAGKGPALVINCGTATAFSVIDQRGRFCGGAIAPGLQTQLRALAGAAAQLPATTLTGSAKALGKSTKAAIRAGVLLGWQGGVAEIVMRLHREVGGKARLIATGGEARHLYDLHCLTDISFRPLLVFEGLRIIADRLPDR